MIQLGQYHELAVVKTVRAGFYLDAHELGEVLLPGRYAPRGLAPGDTLEVFLYLDSEDRPLATTEQAKACVGEFAYLKAVAITPVGAFLDWGLSKDILVPFAEQHRPMEEGHSYLVYLYVDEKDNRIAASSKIDKFLKDDKPHSYTARQAVDLIIANSTDLGFKAIINHSHWGLLHRSDVHQRLSFGQSISGYIKQVRPDTKIDLCLQLGAESRDKQAGIIASYLRRTGGYAAVHDKSDPEEIATMFGMSKSAFKKAIGNLYKNRIIAIEEHGIRLLAGKNEVSEADTVVTEEPVSSPWSTAKIKSKTEPVAEEKGRVVEIHTEPVELYKILKFEALVGSGGEAKTVIAEGLVSLNGQVETQKRKKIVTGDVISFGDEVLRVKLVEKQKD